MVAINFEKRWTFLIKRAYSYCQEATIGLNVGMILAIKQSIKLKHVTISKWGGCVCMGGVVWYRNHTKLKAHFFYRWISLPHQHSWWIMTIQLIRQHRRWLELALWCPCLGPRQSMRPTIKKACVVSTWSNFVALQFSVAVGEVGQPYEQPCITTKMLSKPRCWCEQLDIC